MIKLATEITTQYREIYDRFTDKYNECPGIYSAYCDARKEAAMHNYRNPEDIEMVYKVLAEESREVIEECIVDGFMERFRNLKAFDSVKADFEIISESTAVNNAYYEFINNEVRPPYYICLFFKDTERTDVISRYLKEKGIEFSDKAKEVTEDIAKYRNNLDLYSQIISVMNILNDSIFVEIVNNYILYVSPGRNLNQLFDKKVLVMNSVDLNSSIKDIRKLDVTDRYSGVHWSINDLSKQFPDIPAYVSMLSVMTMAEEIVRFNNYGTDVVGLLFDDEYIPKRNDIYRIVNSAFVNFDCFKNSETYAFDRDAKALAAIVKECIKNYLEFVLIKSKLNVCQLFYDKNKTSKKKDKHDDIMAKLKKENEALKEKLKNNNAVSEGEVKKLKDNAKSLKADVAKLNKDKKDLKYENQKLMGKIKMLEMIPLTDEVESKESLKDIDINAIIEGKKIFVWGCRDNVKKIYENPAFTVSSSDVKVTAKQLEKYDAIIVRTDYCCHPSYYAFINEVKKSGKPFEIMGRNANNQQIINESIMRLFDGDTGI